MHMHTTPIVTGAAARPLTEIEFCAWVGQAAPGDRLRYHAGFLILDTFPTAGRLSDQERRELSRTASRAFWAARQGLVHLVQQRLGDDRFAYIAVARPRPKHAPVALSALLTEEQAA